MLHHRVMRVAAAALLIALASSASADGPFRYPEARHGGGELKYVGNIPVLTVIGSPEEIGDQLGALALKPAVRLTKLADEFLTHYGWKQIYDLGVDEYLFAIALVEQFLVDRAFVHHRCGHLPI